MYSLAQLVETILDYGPQPSQRLPLTRCIHLAELRICTHSADDNASSKAYIRLQCFFSLLSMRNEVLPEYTGLIHITNGIDEYIIQPPSFAASMVLE